MSEQNFTAKDVTVAVLNYNGVDKIPDLFASIERLTTPPAEVIMVDDGSTDFSTQWVQEHHPHVRIITFPRNTGMLNVVRNASLKEAKTDLVFILDNDVVLLKDCLEKALVAMNTMPDATVCATRAVHEEDPDRIYQDGQLLHYVGASPNINRDKTIAEADTEPRLSIGWGVQLINRKRSAIVGWFNEEYFMGWGDDGEFNHKLNIAGLNCYHVPASVVIHKRHTSSKRYFGTVTNRWRFILEMYHIKTLFLVSPALLLYELLLMAFLVMKGSLCDYFRGMMHFAKNIKRILAERKKIQARRMIPDRQLIGNGDIFVYTDEFSSPVLTVGYKMMNFLFNSYWQIIRKLI